uniref:Saposin B-type domain-containing protein n=1 Tax=Ditylenchus dipsaci TaxID=166011 RepID=A0A915ENL3_9BILA
MQSIKIFFCLLCLAVSTHAGPEIDIDEAELPFEFPYPYPYPPNKILFEPGAYCSRCLAVVGEYCQILPSLSVSPCADFNQVSAESLCARIGAYSLCRNIAEDLSDARALVSSYQADSYGICQALQLCP